MAVIKVEGLSFSYPSRSENVFENVSFQIDTDWKLGFIGRNGRGKTTFLKLLLKKYEFGGKIISPVDFGYFPYAVRDISALTEKVLQDVCPAAEEWRVMRELNQLDVDCGCLYRPFKTLSNGERTKVLLAALFLNEEKFMLIDEPTNHLDAQARERLSAYLRKKKSFILVSHDRRFLDGCIDHILSLNKTNIEVRSGDFSSFMLDYERKQRLERKTSDRLQTDIRRLSETARRTAEWADAVERSKIGAGDKGYVGHKSAKMMKRAKVTEARRNKEIEEKSALLKNTEIESPLKFSPLTYRAERIALFSSVAPVYDGKAVCAPLSFEIKRGDRIALDGKNGCGKSSLLKLLCGQKIEFSGKLDRLSDVVVSYVPQDASFLRGTPADIADANGIDESLFKTVLHKMGFDKNEFDNDVSKFSDGQKKKTLIAKSLCERAHLYVWDEPLNYIDVFSRIQIENLLCDFKPTIIFVEHDKAFREKTATKTVSVIKK